MIAGLAAAAAAGVLLAARNKDRILASQPAKDVADRIAEGAGATAEKAHVLADSVESGALGLADSARSAAEALADRAEAAAEATAEGAERVDGAVAEAAERVAAAAHESTEAAEEAVTAAEADGEATPRQP